MRNIVAHLRRAHLPMLTQSQLAKYTGLARSSIASIERGREVTGRNMLIIAKFFNKDPREIFFIDDVANTTQESCDVV